MGVYEVKILLPPRISVQQQFIHAAFLLFGAILLRPAATAEAKEEVQRDAGHQTGRGSYEQHTTAAEDAQAVQESKGKGRSRDNPLLETVDMVSGLWYVAASPGMWGGKKYGKVWLETYSYSLHMYIIILYY